MSTTYCELNFDKIIATAPKAILLDIAGDDHWIPHSLIDGGRDAVEDGPGTIEVAEWFATKEGLI